MHVALRKHTARFFALIAMMAVMATALSAKKPDHAKPSEADCRKADYIYMEAMRQQALGNDDASFYLMQRAHELNPDDDAIAYFFGYTLMGIAGQDSVRFESGHRLMKNYFDRNPADFYTSYTYGFVNERIGNIDESLRVWNKLDSLYPAKTEVALHLANALFLTHDSAAVSRTIDVYNRIERAKGKSIPLSSRKIQSYLSTQDTVSAIAEVHSLIEASPGSIENNVFAGDVFALFSENDSALAYYNRACELDPTSGLAYYSRANFYKNAGDSVAYDREVFHALKMESLDLDTKLEIMTGYVRELYSNPAQQPRIQELFASLLEQHPHEVSVHDLYYAYLLAISDYAGAAEQVGYALDIDPSDERKWGALVSLYLQTDEFDKAVDAATRALGYHPQSANLTFMRGISHGQAKQYDKAIPDFERSIELADSGDVKFVSEVLSSEGDMYSAAGDKAQAEEHYRQAIAVDPDNLLALNNYAYLLAVEGRDLDKAERMSSRTIQERPDDINSLDTYAWILFRQKKYTEALAYIQKALDLAKEPADELYSHAGDIYFWNGDHQKAVELWQQALLLAPDNELLKRKVAHKTFFFE
ncbi:MAG: tetratricopeptide repeat protein [Muribaculum sp.]|nr:tetratricopeptide repeat protein [Muribaculum sp.]